MGSNDSFGLFIHLQFELSCCACYFIRTRFKVRGLVVPILQSSVRFYTDLRLKILSFW